MKWGHIDWENNRFTVPSPKTGDRIVPIFPELRPYLERQFDAAAEGEELVLPGMVGTGNTAYSKRLLKVVGKLEVDRWSRVFHSMRSTRQTELQQRFPSYVVCQWMGNSEKIADAHYLQVLETHFAQALHNPLQQVPATTEKTPQPK